MGGPRSVTEATFLKIGCLTPIITFASGSKVNYVNYSALCHKGGTKNLIKMLPFQVYAIFQLPKIHRSSQQFLFLLPATQKIKNKEVI